MKIVEREIGITITVNQREKDLILYILNQGINYYAKAQREIERGSTAYTHLFTGREARQGWQLMEKLMDAL